MIIEIGAEDAAAHALPAIGFRVDTARTGLGGRPFQQLGQYLNLCGPPGGRESFLVRAALEPQSDAAAVEREVRRQEGRQLAEGIAEHGDVFIAGARRPAIAYVTGDGIFRMAWCSTLVGTPVGALLVEVGIGWSKDVAPRCADVVGNPRMRELVQSFALLDGIRAAKPGAKVYPFDPDALRQFDDVLGSAKQIPLSRERLLGFRPEGLMGSVFDEPQPSPGIGLTRLACARQLEASGVPETALLRCIEAWRAARSGLPAGAVPDARLVRLDAELAEAALGAPKLGRWMAALRSHATTTRALDHACHFLDDVTTIWTDLLSHGQEQGPDQASAGSVSARSRRDPSTPVGETISRAQLLAIAPRSMMEAVFAPPDASSDAGTAMLALVEQLRAANVPLQALELCIVAWSAALDGLAPGTQVPADRLAHLDDSLDLQTRGFEALARWMTAMRQRVSSAETLDLAIQFLLRARTTWTLGDAMRARQAGR